jgi:hypothetical protein
LYLAQLIAPNSASYEDANDYSAVLRLTYGNNTFLFMGDVQALSESEIINDGYSLKADILKDKNKKVYRAHLMGPITRLYEIDLPYHSFCTNICIPPIWTKPTNCYSIVTRGINKFTVTEINTNMSYSMT